MKKERLLQYAKWGWLLLVVGGVAYYLTRNYAFALSQIRSFSAEDVTLSILFLLIGKLFLAYLNLLAIDDENWKPAFPEMLYINSITQLAKYLPGGVWHFVGKFGVYKANGLSITQAGKSILIENIWLVLSGFFWGVSLMLLFSNELLRWIQPHNSMFVKYLLLFLFPLLWAVGLFLAERFVRLDPLPGLLRIMLLLLVQVMIWLFLGLSFWVLLPGEWNWELTGLSSGVFALSWVTGYVTLFAPGGLGVREAVLAALLASAFEPDMLLIYAAFNRLIWILVEIGLGIFTTIFLKPNGIPVE